MIAVKATETRMHDSTKFVYNQINNLYAEDIIPRVMGMYTFSDGNEPSAIAAVKAAGIQISEGFKFNNSAIFMHPEAKVDSMNISEFFNRNMDNHAKFINYIKEKDQMPLSLNLTRGVLEHRKQMETLGLLAKQKAEVLTLNMFEIGNKIKEVRRNVKFLNSVKDDIILPVGTRSAYKEKKVDHQVIRCTECIQDERSICH